MTDHHKVYESLFNARVKWHNLGGSLGLDYVTLRAIERKYHRDDQECLREMLAKRLQSDGLLSWSKLCDCLRSPTVGCNDIAASIEQEIGRDQV